MFLLYILPFNLSTTFYKKMKKSKFKIYQQNLLVYLLN